MILPKISLGARSGLDSSIVGLGCSRLGSTLSGCTGREADRLLRHAIEAGVILFDTANIYGQGESERLIGAAIRGCRDQVILVTKAGQRFTLAQRMAALAKSPLRQIARQVPALRGAIAQRRAAALPRDYSPAHLKASVEASLRRLKVERIDLFLWHSPEAGMIGDEAAFDMMERLVQAGKMRAWGMSCDDVHAAEAALRVPGVAVLQLPLAVAEMMRPALASAAAQGVGLMLREIFAGQAQNAGARENALQAALDFESSVALVGTTSITHLDEALEHARHAHLHPSNPETSA